MKGIHSFQSHYGAIATPPFRQARQHGEPFQSHYGAIATVISPNPILVSLPVSIPLWCDCDGIGDVDDGSLCEFQSHYGAIATTQSQPNPCSRPLFQSHYGAIATWKIGILDELESRRFNPTMVRLRLLLPQMPISLVHQFQSHYGAIATLTPIQIAAYTAPFQSHYGAIATTIYNHDDADHDNVSIPLWCDCDYLANLTVDGLISRFNPTMVRLRPKEVFSC